MKTLKQITKNDLLNKTEIKSDYIEISGFGQLNQNVQNKLQKKYIEIKRTKILFDLEKRNPYSLYRKINYYNVDSFEYINNKEYKKRIDQHEQNLKDKFISDILECIQ